MKRFALLSPIRVPLVLAAAVIALATIASAQQDLPWVGTWGVAPASETIDPSNNGG